PAPLSQGVDRQAQKGRRLELVQDRHATTCRRRPWYRIRQSVEQNRCERRSFFASGSPHDSQAGVSPIASLRGVHGSFGASGPVRAGSGGISPASPGASGFQFGSHASGASAARWKASSASRASSSSRSNGSSDGGSSSSTETARRR